MLLSRVTSIPHFFSELKINYLCGTVISETTGTMTTEIAIQENYVVLTDWRYVFVADFEALHCQITRKFIRCRNAETRTVSAIKYTACYALAVLVCPLVPVKLHFHIKLVNRFIFFSVWVAGVFACFNFFLAWEKNFEILLLGWLCKLF